MAAYVLDWLVALIAGWLLVLIAAAILLANTDLNRRDPSDSALVAALLVLAAWLPLWFLYTALAWSWRGATIGMAATGIGVTRNDGRLAGPFQTAARTLLLALFSLPLLLSPLLVGVAAALGSAGPLYVWIPIAALIVLSAVACFAAFTSADGRTWYDRASRTQVILAQSPGAAGFVRLEEQ